MFVDIALQRAAPCFCGEFAIALSYFVPDSPWRDDAQDRRWLEVQIWKEWYGSGVYGPEGVTVEHLLKDAIGQLKIPTGTDGDGQLQDVRALLDFGRDEFAHFTLLFDLWRRTFPDEVADIPAWGALEQGRALTQLRYAYAKDPLGQIAVRLSEGGGLGLFFGIQHALQSGVPFDLRLKEIVARILADEQHHLTGNFAWASRQLRSEADQTRVADLLKEICTVKLREREAQFGIELSRIEGTLQRATSIYQTRFLQPLREEIKRLEASDEIR